jgi:hypothetical protein
MVVASRPVRRILFGTLRSVGGHPSRPAIARRLQRPTRGLTGGTTLPLLGLAPDGVYRATRVAPGAGALLPHRFTLTCAADIPLQVGPVAIGGLLSVALSCGSPRLGVTQHPALWSPDVPRTDHHPEERVRTRPPGRLATAPIQSLAAVDGLRLRSATSVATGTTSPSCRSGRRWAR